MKLDKTLIVEAEPLSEVLERLGRTTSAEWGVYLLECRNGCWYAGITNALDRRLRLHATGRGAHYTRAHPPVGLIGWRSVGDRSAALKAEARLKRMRRSEKLLWIRQATPEGRAARPDAPLSRP